MATSLRFETLGVVGTGVMAEAMVAGVLREHAVPPARITCSHPRQARRDELAQRYGVTTTASNLAASSCEVVILGIKPQILPKVMGELRGRVDPAHLVISIAAGASTMALKHGLDHSLVVRAMPNTPAQIGDGVTVWFAPSEVDAGHREVARSILSGLGVQIEAADEEDVAKATAISGTGPTYVFLFIEAMIDAA